MLYCSLFGRKLEGAFFMWNSVTSTDASNHERIFVTVIFSVVCGTYTLIS